MICIVVLALLFDFINGFHDAANSIATVVSTRVLKPKYAVAWAAFFNFVAFLLIGVQVAQTIGTGIVRPAAVDGRLLLAALGGAIVIVGATKRLTAVRWGVAVHIVWAWILTILVSAGVSAILYGMLAR